MKRDGDRQLEIMRKRKGAGGLVKHAISVILAEVAENKSPAEQYDTAKGEVERVHEILETMLAMTEAFCSLQQEIKAFVPEDEVFQGRCASDGEQEDVARLSHYLIHCQYFSVVRLERETATMHPLLVIGPSAEDKEQWHQRLEGESLLALLGDDVALLEHLSAGNMLSLDVPAPQEDTRYDRCLIVPVRAEQRLEGLLLLLPSFREEAEGEELHPYLLQVVTRMASLMIAFQQAIHERDQVLVMLNDVYAELERLNTIKSDFVAMMNNEFRSTVLSIQEASKAISDQDVGLTDAREFALDIYTDAQRLLHLIADQLEFSWLATGRKRLQQNWLDLNAIIVDVVNRLRLTTRHLIRLQLARALPVLMGDQKKLAGVIAHLLKDAMQYSPDGGEIYVSSVVEGHFVHICIRDQGAGVSSDELEQLFADHPRSDGEAVMQPLQSLLTMREIVQMHGGMIWAESSPGMGSAFHFTIPFIERNWRENR
ncbi:hypothetical protein KSF_022580 [Reticulibacter mediterranei]|uniref:histidine kinase n=1 Tax=Reticulibacter mediterranei TaxID=2778369 RepID=A0A8J3IGW7_9CHLR|nr:ATP-binding protein [Reticulibacter mediterranei]GHO92210.1 hypothetical protein KSF_022580 [Reticulibacter mediterranei]